MTDLTGQQEELSIEGTEITCYAHKVYNRTLFECSCKILLWEVSEREALVTYVLPKKRRGVKEGKSRFSRVIVSCS